MSWRALADAVLAAILAPPCAACERLVDSPLDGAVCRDCWRSIAPLSPPLCITCGDPLPSWRVASVHASRCARCRRVPPLVARGAAIGAYDGALRRIIHALKYDGRRSVSPRLSALMAEHGCAVLEGADVAVPVPLHPRRERERGFNQADDLARGLGLPVCQALARVRSTRPQVDLPAAQRHRNVRDAFVVRGGTEVPPSSSILGRWGVSRALRGGTEVPPSSNAILGGRGFSPAKLVGGTEVPPSLQGKVVVLVDDVATTGATLNACAAVLLRAGAREVRALTAARVVCARP